jgi:hypothetical protein
MVKRQHLEAIRTILATSLSVTGFTAATYLGALYVDHRCVKLESDGEPI